MVEETHEEFGIAGAADGLIQVSAVVAFGQGLGPLFQVGIKEVDFVESDAGREEMDEGEAPVLDALADEKLQVPGPAGPALQAGY